MRKPWLRLYVDIIDNEKVQTLAPDDAWLLVNLWALAKENDGVLPPVSRIAWRLRRVTVTLQEALQRLVCNGLLHEKDGVFTPHDWAEHQYEHSKSRDRVRKYRERQRAENTPVASGNAKSSVTVTQKGRYRNAPDTDTDTDERTLPTLSPETEQAAGDPKRGDSSKQAEAPKPEPKPAANLVTQMALERAKQPKAPPKSEAPPGVSLAWLRDALVPFRRDWPPPGDDVLRKVQRACGAASQADVYAELSRLHGKGVRPEIDWAWFVTVLNGKFAGFAGVKKKLKPEDWMHLAERAAAAAYRRGQHGSITLEDLTSEAYLVLTQVTADTEVEHPEHFLNHVLRLRLTSYLIGERRRRDHEQQLPEGH